MNARVEPLRVGLAVVTAVAMVAAMMVVFGSAPALGQPEDQVCPQNTDGWSSHFTDDPHLTSGDFGSIQMSGDGEDELLTASINEGYTVEICVKQAQTVNFFTVTSDNDGTIWAGDLSHWSYRVFQVEDTTTTTTAPTTTTVAPTTTTTVAPTTTTIPDDVLGTVITTSTTAPVVAVTTTIPDEVLDTEVVAEELPFTGPETGWLFPAAVLLLISGLLITGLTGSSRED